MVGTEDGGTQGLALAPATVIITGLVRLGMGLGPVHDKERRPGRLLTPRNSWERRTEPSHREGVRDCSALLAAAEVTNQPHCDALAPLIARRTGRRQSQYVEMRQGLKAEGFSGGGCRTRRES
jgi:hypothetical protein